MDRITMRLKQRRAGRAGRAGGEAADRTEGGGEKASGTGRAARRGRRPFHERDRGEWGAGAHSHGRGRHGGSRGRGPRTRRGDIRIALLAALGDGPAHGYELIQRLAARTGGRWKPSPGSVYPTLQMMEDGGLVSSAQQGDKKVYAITEAGRAELDTRVSEAGGALPWLDGEAASGHGDLRKAVAQLVMAARQVGVGGDETQAAEAARIIDEARRKLYQLLADA